MRALAPELVEAILEHLEDDKHTLAVCCRVTKTFQQNTERILYRHVEVLLPRPKPPRFTTLMPRFPEIPVPSILVHLANTPRCARFCRSLVLAPSDKPDQAQLYTPAEAERLVIASLEEATSLALLATNYSTAGPAQNLQHDILRTSGVSRSLAAVYVAFEENGGGVVAARQAKQRLKALNLGGAGGTGNLQHFYLDTPLQVLLDIALRPSAYATLRTLTICETFSHILPSCINLLCLTLVFDNSESQTLGAHFSSLATLASLSLQKTPSDTLFNQILPSLPTNLISLSFDSYGLRFPEAVRLVHAARFPQSVKEVKWTADFWEDWWSAEEVGRLTEMLRGKGVEKVEIVIIDL
ncbi:hypothetical protein JCM11641_005487 [Rhodosporidiobolus odoratus]